MKFRDRRRQARPGLQVLSQVEADRIFAPLFNRELAIRELRAKARAGGAVTISAIMAQQVADQLERDAS